jgi:phosphatidylglycerol:prolipoprotein diacylglycerol transferase
MCRVLWEAPSLGLSVPSFGLFLFLGTFAALGLTFWRARREMIEPESVAGLAAWLLTGGLIGARFLYILGHPETVRSVGDIFKVWQGGIVYYGCLIGGLIGSTLYWLRKPFPFRAMADVVAPALALGSAIGRVGCLLNGCCYGAVCDHPWAMTFASGSLPWAKQVEVGLIPVYAGHSLPIHPTQVYAALDGILLLALLSAFFPRRRRDGEVMALLTVTYPVTRFLIEGLRADEPALVLGMTMSQGISVGIFLAGLVAWSLLWRQPVGRYADGASKSVAHPPATADVIPRPHVVPQHASGHRVDTLA